jgi:hypothetical protein
LEKFPPKNARHRFIRVAWTIILDLRYLNALYGKITNSHLTKLSFISKFWPNGFRKIDFRALLHLRAVSTLRLEDNYLNAVPFDILSLFNGSLEMLNLTMNTFSELGPADFPLMKQLNVLILDACRIQNIHKAQNFKKPQ